MKTISGVTVGILFFLVVFVVVVEWLAGCGESYVDANGVRHQNECVLIPKP
jgi:hypothetical protein